MRIAFLKPPIGGILGLEMLTFVEPLGPECVAACLVADGHECAILDLRIDGRERGLERCLAFEPDVVGIQCNFTTERRRSAELARTVLDEDDAIDSIQDEVILTMMRELEAHPETASQDVDIILVAKHLERVADHATNIAEDVIYLVTGHIVRHKPEANPRIPTP